jgi:hypothetical protein
MAENDPAFDRSLGSIKNLLFTALADHARDKKLLRAPFHKLQRDWPAPGFVDTRLS